MSLQTFFDNFVQLADAPNGVAKLRELVLRFAVRGKLVFQNPDEEPAIALIERGLGSRKLSAVPSPAEVPHEIPPSWSWVKFENIVEFEMGRTPPTKASVYWDTEPNGVPWVSIADMPHAGWVAATSKRVTDKAISDIFKRPPKPVGTLLMSFKLSIGKVAFLSVQAYHNEAIISIFPFHPEIKPYLFECLRGINLLTESNNAIKGSTLNSTSLRALLIPLPPLEEQKRIVAKVDELMRLCDELEARQQARRESRARLNNATLAPLNNPASLGPEDFGQAVVRLSDNFDVLCDSVDTVGKLRSTILQLAVQGKLIPQYPADEASLMTGGSLDESDILFPSPPSWRWTGFGQVAEIVSGVTKGRKLDGRKTAVYPYLRVANVQRWFLDLRVMKEIDILEDEIERYRLEKDDLLITEGGDWDKVGRTAIWNNEIENCVHQNHVFRARVSDPTISPLWIMTFLNSATGRRYFESASKQTTNLASINMRQLRACPLAVPPLEAQKRIVAKVAQLMALCDELETKLRQAEADSEKLLNAAVQHVLAAVSQKTPEGLAKATA